MRKLPNYTGEDETTNVAIYVNADEVEIPRPFEQGELNEQLIVKVNDYISFNYSSLKYRIKDVQESGSKLSLSLDLVGGFLPGIQDDGGGGHSYVIYRRPRKLRSSRLDLPDGYLVDLRVSGDANGLTPLAQPGIETDVMYIFDSRGGIDRVIYDNGGGQNADRPLGTLYLMVRGFGVEEIDERVDTVLSDPANLWVTVDKTVGSANVVHSQPYDSTLATAALQLKSAREIAIGGQSAAQ
jgi:hypothetical protein